MKYLLDVNALLACEHRGSPHQVAFNRWAEREGLGNLASCAYVGLGFKIPRKAEPHGCFLWRRKSVQWRTS